MKWMKIGIAIGIFFTCFAALMIVHHWMRTPLEIDADLVRSHPKSITYREFYGYDLQAAGRPVEAEREYRAALRIDPASKSARYLLGKALEAQGRNSEARTEWRTALPGAPPALARDIRAAIASAPSP
ncbi:MAG TPA: tetratricopeptide repeat protein [Chthonomonadaceae bacterium]|nr:tetratricopeptide repeat protein [Chthonomonadaceae bacterium]